MNEDKILQKELGKLGALGGGIGGEIGQGLLGASAGALGGKIGAEWAAKHIGNDTVTLNVEVPEQPDLALRKIYEVLAELGKIVETEETDTPTISAVMGSGFMNMNPAVVTVTLLQQTKNGTIISVRGTAKEGLIKQHAGSKAANRVVESLNAR